MLFHDAFHIDLIALGRYRRHTNKTDAVNIQSVFASLFDDSYDDPDQIHDTIRPDPLLGHVQHCKSQVGGVGWCKPVKIPGNIHIHICIYMYIYLYYFFGNYIPEI